MKKINTFFLVASFVLIGCEGPQGLSGFDGQDGIDGVNADESFVFEYELSFTAPNYSALLNLPSDFTMLDSDVMLMYLLWEIKDGEEIWRAVPQTLFFSDGQLHYNYDFTKFDATIFLDGTVNLNALGADYTDNWIARVVVVPGQFVNGRTSLDVSDYNQVKDFYELTPSQLASATYRSRPE